MDNSQKKKTFLSQVSISNKKARFEYEFLDTLICGIVLQGSEIKSIREGKISIQESYCYFSNTELFIKGMNITPYSKATYFNHEPTRERKLLLKKREIVKWEKKTEEKGLTIVPVKIFINQKGYAKLEIALAKGKKLYDKREVIKERDLKKELNRKYI
ncbi:MAG: SsrA-binding protein SmpB [Chitinophagaceae bacterium]|nr:SsrA-binding protein SmpB [Chitinophagaceae bacterium]